MSTPRITASGRVQRLLALLQHADAHPEGIEVEALCRRFRMQRADLVRELEMASLIGGDASPYADEMPVEFFLEDGRAFVHLRAFHRPLRLTPAEALALVAAADVLVDREGAVDEDAPLARAMAKLADHLGVQPGAEVDVDLDPDGGDVGRALQRAVDDRLTASFTYWTYGRDEVARREVEPWGLHQERDAWYLVGWDLDREAERRFRLDRIVDLVVGDAPARTPRPRQVSTLVDFADDAPRVVLDLAPAARWVVDVHPVEAVEPAPDDHLRVTLAVSGSSWLERLLLRLDGAARIVSIDPQIGGPDLVEQAAARVLARYRR